MGKKAKCFSSKDFETMAKGVVAPLFSSFGWWGLLLWLAISITFTLIYTGEYLERSDSGKSNWKAAMQVIRCLSSILGTAAGCTVFLFTIFYALDGDPETGDPALEIRRRRKEENTS